MEFPEVASEKKHLTDKKEWTEEYGFPLRSREKKRKES